MKDTQTHIIAESISFLPKDISINMNLQTVEMWQQLRSLPGVTPANKMTF